MFKAKGSDAERGQFVPVGVAEIAEIITQRWTPRNPGALSSVPPSSITLAWEASTLSGALIISAIMLPLPGSAACSSCRWMSTTAEIDLSFRLGR